MSEGKEKIETVARKQGAQWIWNHAGREVYLPYWVRSKVSAREYIYNYIRTNWEGGHCAKIRIIWV